MSERGEPHGIDGLSTRARIRSFFTAFLVLAVVSVSFGQVASAQGAEPTPSEAPSEPSPAPEGGSAEPSPAPTEPTVWTSKDDYVPAEVVDLNGAGWNAGESVELFVNDDEGKSWSHTGTATADDLGAFVYDLQLPGHFVATYTVKATGDSGRVALTSFADSVAVGLSSTNSNGATGLASQQITISAPPMAAGDVLVSQIVITDAITSTVICPPPGWTSILNNNRDDKIRHHTFWFRAASATAAASHTWQFKTTSCGGALISAGTKGASGGLVLLSGAISSGNPIDVSAGGNSSSSGPFNAPSVTTTTANTHILRLFGVFKNTDITHATTPRIYRVASSTTKERAAAVFNDGTKATAGATGTFTATVASSAEMASQTIAIKEQPAQPTVTSDASGSGTYGGTATLTANLTSGGNPLPGKTITFGLNGTALSPTATTNASGVATLTGVSLSGIDADTYPTAVTASFAGDSSYLASHDDGPLTVAPKSVIGSFTAANKVYDGNTSATVAASSLSGVVGSDDVSLTGTATFSDKNVGNGKTVTLNGASLSGADAANYTLGSVPTATANITAKPVTGSFTAENKAYDGTTAATVATTSLPGAVEGDDVTLDVTNAQFDSADVGTGKTVTASLALSGADASNYALTSNSASTTADIAAKAVSGSFTAEDKEYDGNVDASVLTRSISGNLEGDDVSLVGGTASFDTADVGNDKDVTLSGATLDGADAGNYTLTSVADAAADITAKQLTGSFTATDKVYDGTTAATVSGSSLPGVVEGDDVSLVVSDAAFEDANVGTGKTVNATLSLDGSDAGNYALSSTSGTASADITARPITGSFSVADKTYDSTDAATINTGSRALQGVIGSDDVSLVGGSATFASEDVGTHAVTGTGFSLGGTDAGNYSLGSVSAPDASISAKDVTGSFTADDKEYDGNAFAIVSGRALSGAIDGDDVALQGGTATFGNANVGTDKVVTLSGATLGGSDAGNYNLTSVDTATADITARPIEVTADPQTKVYGDADPELTYDVTSGSLVDGESFTGSLDRADGEDVGPYAITQGTLTAGSNYNLSFVGADLTITARNITVTADNKAKTYGDDDPALTYQVTSGSLVDGDTFTGAITRETGETVGEYAITQGTLSAGDNYDLTFVDATFTIGRRAVEVTADPQSKTYGDADPALTYTVTNGSLKDGDSFTGALTRAEGEDVADYAILQGTLDAGTNYDLSYVGANLTITARAMEVTADPRSKTYGDADPELTYEVTNGSLVGDDAFTGGLDREDGEDVGTYAITQGTLTAGPNYDLSYVGDDLTITARPITVTADDKSKTYGDADPALTYQVTSGSLADGDGFTGELDRGAGQDVGDYAITQGTLSAGDNYDLSFVAGTLTINAKSITGSFSVADKTYDGNANASIVDSSRALQGVVGDDDVSLSGGSASFASENVGTHAVTGSSFTLGGADAGNYSLDSVSAPDGSITAKDVTGSFTAADKVYDGNTSATVTSRSLDGAVAGDDVALAGGTATFDTPDIGNDKTVTLNGATLGGTDAGNYNLTSVATTTADITAPSAVTRIEGFYKPIDMTPTGATRLYNTPKGGSTIPMKFDVYSGSTELTSTAGLSVKVVKINCETGQVLPDDIQTVSTSAAGLRYDTTAGQFVFNWTVPKSAGSCYEVTVDYNTYTTMSGIGGTPADHDAFFKVR